MDGVQLALKGAELLLLLLLLLLLRGLGLQYSILLILRIADEGTTGLGL